MWLYMHQADVVSVIPTLPIKLLKIQISEANEMKLFSAF